MKKLAVLSLSALTLSAIYLYAWPAANVFYAGIVLFHVGLGVLFCIGGLRLLPYALRQPAIVKLATLVLIVGAALGLALIYTGASRPYTKLLFSHGAVSALGRSRFLWDGGSASAKGRSEAHGFPRSPWWPLLLS